VSTDALTSQPNLPHPDEMTGRTPTRLGVMTRLGSLLALTACTAAPAGGGESPDSSQALDCSEAPVLTELGVPSRGFPAYLRTSGGPLQFELYDTPTGIFEGVLKRQSVFVGNTSATPEPDPKSSGPVHADFSTRVSADEPAVLDMPAGHYWVVGGTGRVRVRHCGDVVLSDVAPPSGAPGENFGVEPD
jgi:hypothetical protein